MLVLKMLLLLSLCLFLPFTAFVQWQTATQVVCVCLMELGGRASNGTVEHLTVALLFLVR